MEIDEDIVAKTSEDLVKKYPMIFTKPGWARIPDGWVPLVDKLCQNIQEQINGYNYCVFQGFEGYKEEIPQVVCQQMKEKFATLRFYAVGGDKTTQGMISFAESLSASICQDCGKWGAKVRGGSWIKTQCDDCAKND